MRYIGGRQQACLTFLLELVWSMKASAGSQLFLLKPQMLAQQGLTARCSLGAEPRAQGRAGSALRSLHGKPQPRSPAAAGKRRCLALGGRGCSVSYLVSECSLQGGSCAEG